MTENKALQLGYESNGLKVLSSIIPWFAEKIFLEVAIRFPDKFLCSASDFEIRSVCWIGPRIRVGLCGDVIVDLVDSTG